MNSLLHMHSVGYGYGTDGGWVHCSRAKHCFFTPSPQGLSCWYNLSVTNLLLPPLGHCCPNLMKSEKKKFPMPTHPSGPGFWLLWSSAWWPWYQSWQCEGCWCPARLWHCASGCRSGACLSCLWSSGLHFPGQRHNAGSWNRIFNNMNGCDHGQKWKDMKAWHEKHLKRSSAGVSKMHIQCI